MNQQINLYLPEFKVKKDPLTAVLMGQVLGGVIVLMFLVTVYDVVHRWNLNRELADLRETLTEETRKTDELNVILARRSQNPELTARLDSAEARLQASRQIRDFLSETKLGNVMGFSEYFKDLSRAAIDGLSINRFSFSEGGEVIEVSGQVLDSAMVPRYVTNIRAGNSPLRDKRYSPSISRPEREDGYFSFNLRSSSE